MPDHSQTARVDTRDDVTVGDAIRILAQVFRDAGLETPARDAQLLVQGATGLTREAVVSSPTTPVSNAAIADIKTYQARRLRHEPVSRILGRRDFYGRTFKISPATLDPRPETESVVECVLSFTRAKNLQAVPLRVIDVGTGSGILLLTLLAELPNATGLGTDLSSDALAVAADNATILDLSDRAQFACHDGLADVAGTFDILVSNPPYIAGADIADLAPDVRDFDPHLALNGGPDGLSCYRMFAPQLCRIVPHGLAAFEVGFDQSDDVVDILRTQCSCHGAVQISVLKDLAGHNRCVALQTHC